MKECWKELPDKRPTFSELVTTISTSLEAIAGYLDFTAAPFTADGNVGSGRDPLTGKFKNGYDNFVEGITDVDGDNQEEVD